jgi:pilus assembly protein CpaF
MVRVEHPGLREDQVAVESNPADLQEEVMALLDRLQAKREPGTRIEPKPDDTEARGIVSPRKDAGHDFQELKSRVHNRLFDLLDLTRMSKVSEERTRSDVEAATIRILAEENMLLTLEDQAQLVREIQDEVFGLGPLEPLLADPTVTDILVNGHRQIYVERRGKIETTVARFKDDAHLMRIIEKIVAAVGRRIDETSPMVDARLADGSRVNVIVPPLALDGPSMSIRRFGTDPLREQDLVDAESVTSEIFELLRGVIQARLNVLISGGTGSGKTTMLNVMSSFIPEDERIVTIEDSAELLLKQEHVVRLETRPANLEGNGQISQRELVINSLRMRPDRIVVGEVRGAEALDMLQAMNTGHDGSLTTVHANSARDALTRIETMVAMSGLEIPQRAVRNQLASAIDVVIQLERLSDGKRKLTSLQEVNGMEGDIVTMQEIFTLERKGIDAERRVLAEVVPTGIRPRFAERLRLAGVDLPDTLFQRRMAA